jgi:hypothetical protein
VTTGMRVKMKNSRVRMRETELLYYSMKNKRAGMKHTGVRMKCLSAWSIWFDGSKVQRIKKSINYELGKDAS